MHDEDAFLQAMQERPYDTTLRLVFADWLEERGDPRAELMRLLHTLTAVEGSQNTIFRRVVSSLFSTKKATATVSSATDSERQKFENRLRSLLASGVRPVGPFITNTIGMKFAWIPAGTFLMGSPVNEDEERQKYETQHKVTLNKGFYLTIYPVTQAYWEEIMGTNPSFSQGDSLPVEQVSWDDCRRFLGQLGERDGHAYRLPTEAEWEYACRGGTTTPFSFGETISADQANFDARYPYGKGLEGLHRGKTTPVGSFRCNAWGLHDMHGNVGEWCADWFGDYPRGGLVDPKGPQRGEFRVVRGGCFGDHAVLLRSALRDGAEPSHRLDGVGFRVVRTFKP